MHFRPAGDAEKLGVAAGAAHGSGQSSPGGTGSQRDAVAPGVGPVGSLQCPGPRAPALAPERHAPLTQAGLRG